MIITQHSTQSKAEVHAVHLAESKRYSLVQVTQNFLDGGRWMVIYELGLSANEKL